MQYISESRHRMTRPDIEREIRSRFPVGRKEISAALRSLLEENELKYTSSDGHSFIEISSDKAVRITEKIILKPPNIPFAAREDEIVINLSFGASFGSGSHPTTRLALAGIEYALSRKSYQRDIRTSALDIGTGSGVLAIAAVKMGIGSAIGTDIDPCAISEASENVRLNDLEDRIRIVNQDIEDIRLRFSMILANLRLPTLKQMFSQIAEMIERDGILIISGIYNDEISDLNSIYTKRFECGWQSYAKGWSALIYRS